MREGVPYGRRLTQLAETRRDERALVVALIDGVEPTYTWGELDARANQVGRLLASAGVGADDLVVVGLGNRAEHVFTTFGAWKVGASVLPLRVDLPAWERARLLDIATPTVVVADWPEGHPLTTADLAESTRLDPSALTADHVPAYSRLIASSGSTGVPKIIATPAPGLFVSAEDSGNKMIAAESVAMSASPLYHTNGFAYCYPPLLQGSTVVLMEHFDAARAVELIERHRVTATVLVPTMLQRIARLDDIRGRDLSSLEQVVYGGAVLPAWAARTWLELIEPERLVLSYGGSEGIGLCVGTGRDWLTHPGTTGRPLDCELLVLDAAHRPVPTGEVGEIWLRPLVPAEPYRYLGVPTPEPILDGYHSFGDLGHVDADGFLYIADRRTDMIVTGGVNVFPAEVEAALSEHPGVADAVVIGLPDPEWGRRVYAIVEPRDPLDPPTSEDLRRHCRGRLSGPKVPKEFEIVDRLPRSAAGKINRGALTAARSDVPATDGAAQ